MHTTKSSSRCVVQVVCSYLDWFLLLENRCEVRQDQANVLLLGALLCDQQHVGQHKGNHVWVDKLRSQRWQDAIHHHSLRERKKKDGLKT